MTCANCGTTIPSAARFCGSCGMAVAGRGTAGSRRFPPALLSGLRIAGLAAVIGLVFWTVAYGAVTALLRYTLPRSGALTTSPAFDGWLAAHGAIAGVGVTLTVGLWIWVATRLAIAMESRMNGPVDPRTRTATALSSAVTYTALVVSLNLTIGVNSVRIGNFASAAPIPTGDIMLNSVVVLGVVFVAAMQGIQGDPRDTRLGPSAPGTAAWLRPARYGGIQIAQHTAAIATIIVATHLASNAWDQSRLVTVGHRRFVYAAAETIGIVFFTGLDLAFGYLLSAMSFFRIELYGFGTLPGTTPQWAWFGLPLFLAVFILGGYSARAFAPELDGSSIRSGLAAGLGFAAIAVVSSGIAFPNLDGLTKTAVIYSAAWALLPALGAAVGARTAPLRSAPPPSYADLSAGG